MSSNEEDINGGGTSTRDLQGSKKRKISHRACDVCRRRKIRCDGPQKQRNKCSHCTQQRLECTYIETSTRRTPSKGYVQGLENQIQEMDNLLLRLCPDELTYRALKNTLGKDVLPEESLDFVSAGSSSYPSHKEVPPVLDNLATMIRDGPEKLHPSTYPDDDEGPALFLSDTLKELSVQSNEYRLYGKSSEAHLIQKAVEVKSEYAGGASKLNPVMKNYRSGFWTRREWEKHNGVSNTTDFVFPDADLSNELIANYFQHFNLYLPLLHRPTFEKALKQKEHLENPSFAVVYLLVCALGSRFSDDPRVLMPRDPLPHSAGWCFFEQTIGFNQSPMVRAKLYDLQYYPLAVEFLSDSSMPQSCWILIGFGLRLAQDVGIHRQKLSQKVTAQDELWRRAFWILIILDRMFSSSLGRPCAMHDEDFDLDMPIDLDDEYWVDDDLTKSPNPPPEKPSKISAFILYIKLVRVLSFALRTVYAINKSKILRGFTGPVWEQATVTELDAALNTWVDSVPPHLRWDPNHADEDDFNQSVFLYSTYYLVQIVIHRPFIPTPTKRSPLSFPSLAICTNAARSCSHLVDLQRRRTTVPPMSHVAVYTSGIVLLLGIWSGKRSGLPADVVKKDMEDVHMCMQVLKEAEERWLGAGRLWDILYELAHAGELPLPELDPRPTNKRAREIDVPNAIDGSLPKESNNRPIAGMRRTYKDKSLPLPGQPQASATPTEFQQFSPEGSTSTGNAILPAHSVDPWRTDVLSQLPLYTNDLGRMPLHGPFSFTPSTDYPRQPGPVPSAFPWFSPTLGSATGSGVAGQEHRPPTASEMSMLTEMFSMREGSASMPPSLDNPPIASSSRMSLEFIGGVQSQPPPLQMGNSESNRMPMGDLGDLIQPPHQVAQDNRPQQSTSSTSMPVTGFGLTGDEVMSLWLNAPGLFVDNWGNNPNGHDPESF